jgi:hypothetical protein
MRRRKLGIGIACVMASLVSCSRTAPHLAGTWKSERTTLTITQDHASYRIVAVNPKGILSGNYTGEYRDNRLLLKGPLAPLCGDMQYAEAEGRLTFCGEAFLRVQR